jgi:hypothetical protein
MSGIEPPPFDFQSNTLPLSYISKCPLQDLNPQPLVYKTNALPFKLRGLFQRVGIEPTSLMSKTTALPIKLPLFLLILKKSKSGVGGI